MIQEFWPSTGYAQILTAALATATIIGCFSPRWRVQVFVALQMWIVWFFARYATLLNEPLVSLIGISCAVYFLTREDDEICIEVAHLYVPRILCLAAGEAGLVSQFLMWEISKLFLILQIAVLAAGGMDAGRRLIHQYGSVRTEQRVIGLLFGRVRGST